ncbi:AMIN domain-containing protein [Brevibacillus sp. SYP-B805]|uniref:N-acetylmuramoyl-L-alanine amidase family protein n=1 Tax=Brevibacillus sp. SYP-B805 TaxID=1578199 RepID=UPI0013EC8B0F|nr:N-acetylmuramoyl-L-alanine amidase family protein [Brevibacillus sp. SYP-B805]NGQ96007.1 AMIN domain-containing protein [Brevibacillus sp. SYP-B805]
MKKRWISLWLLFAFCLFGGWGNDAFAEQPGDFVKLVMDGKPVEPDVPPLIQNGRTLVPIRVIAEGLGADVAWDQPTRTATITRENSTLVLQLNRAKAVVNGKEVALDTAPVIYHQRMLLPLRFVGETLGAAIGWDADSRTVVVNRTIALEANGKDLTGSYKPFVLEDDVYLPVERLAEYLGMKNGLNAAKLAGARHIDSQAYIPLARAEELLDAQIRWDKGENRVTIKRVNELDAISTEGDSILLSTEKWVTPQHFVLQGPYRIVLDLPHTVLSDKLSEALADGQASADALEAADQPIQDDKEADDGGQAGSTAQPAAGENSALPLIKSIRYSQYQENPATVRVVIELNQKSNYTVTEKEDGLAIKLAPAPRKTGFLIVLDAGHGGKDNGASGVAGNVEKEYNLSIINRMMELLKQYKEFQVVATRTTDVYLTLQERVAIANERGADLFLSVHANSFKADSRGTETYYYNSYSQAFANIVHRHLLKATQFPDRGVQKSGFYVIKYTKMPAVLTETGFLTNAYENKQMMSPEFRDRVARELVAAIREYYLTVYDSE